MNLSMPCRVLLFLSALFLPLAAQISSGLGAAPVGTYQRISSNGEREFISSVGGAKVGIFRHVRPPSPVYRLRKRYPPVPPTRVPVTGRFSGVLAGLLGGLLGGIGGGVGGLLGR